MSGEIKDDSAEPNDVDSNEPLDVDTTDVPDTSDDRDEASIGLGVIKRWSEAWWAARPQVQRCNGHRRNGNRCQKPAMNGATVCHTHGGATRHVQRKARQRLDDAADRMARQLLKIAESADSESVRLAAVRDALDRAGLKAPTQVDLEVGPKPFEQIMAGMAHMTRAESRAARGIPDPVPAPLAALPVAQPRPQVVEGEVVGGPTQDHTGNRPYWAGEACAPTDRGNVPGEPSAPDTGLMTLAEANEQLRQKERDYNMRQDRHR
ncbi:hypothetical protein [Mycolicibacterium fortuitum]|uniref:hypothetical protein n=1 Tax=Mycolicibacterium fortuitum TaxID=1766 RepID=UPI00148F6B55|nr:hypothetical protein [Mycolicibacterium fortuitum]